MRGGERHAHMQIKGSVISKSSERWTKQISSQTQNQKFTRRERKLHGEHPAHFSFKAFAHAVPFAWWGLSPHPPAGWLQCPLLRGPSLADPAKGPPHPHRSITSSCCPVFTGFITPKWSDVSTSLLPNSSTGRWAVCSQALCLFCSLLLPWGLEQHLTLMHKKIGWISNWSLDWAMKNEREYSKLRKDVPHREPLGQVCVWPGVLPMAEVPEDSLRSS